MKYELVLVILCIGEIAQANWARTWGTSLRREVAQCVCQTSDGGYVVGGSSATGSSSDFLVLKLRPDGSSGDWFKVFHRVIYELVTSICQASDGGYVALGWNDSPGGANVIIKLSYTGAVQWVKLLSAWQGEWARCIQRTSDNGYIVAGTSLDPANNWGRFLVAKLDINGNLQWSKTWCPTNREAFAEDVKQTSEGGYIVAGSVSQIRDPTPTTFAEFVAVIKLDSNGNGQWSHIYDVKEFTVALTDERGLFH